MNRYALGIDIGGTSIKGGVIDITHGEILFYTKVVTKKNKKSFVSSLELIGEELFNAATRLKVNLEGIGIGVPGQVNTKTNVIEFMTNIPGMKIDLNKILGKYNIPIITGNDANAACLGEYFYGAAKGCSNVVVLTLGTGVGGGVIIDNNVLEGKNCTAGELGHVIIDINGPKCNCGLKGCLENYISANALKNITRTVLKKYKKSMIYKMCNNDLKTLSGKFVFESYKKNDPAAKVIIAQYIQNLSIACVNYISIFRPDVLIISGGISENGKIVSDLVNDYVKKNKLYMKHMPKTPICLAGLRSHAGVIGCGALVKKNEQKL